jgi:probable phosphomutase (TIGR03848 family)
MSRPRPTAARRGLSPAPATLVLFVRHAYAQTTGVILSGRTPGLHLSLTGQRQAETLAGRIGLLPKIAAVYSSPLERARETATPIAHARRLPVRLERGLAEVDVGQWTGASLRYLRRRPEWGVVQHHPSGFRFPGGESFTEMQTRITTAIARLVERHPGETIIAVSHADPIKAAVADALGAHLDLFQRIAIAPASVTAIRYRPQGPTVLTVNSMDGDLAVLTGR